jgi:hypothetical protein
MLILPEGQTGDAWKPFKKGMPFRKSGRIGSKIMNYQRGSQAYALVCDSDRDLTVAQLFGKCNIGALN